MKATGIVWICVVALVATGCARQPKIYTNEDPQARFNSYRTFAFEPKLGTDRPDGTRSIISQTLMNATRAELEARGYKFDEERTDLVINFYLESEEKIKARSSPTMGGGYHRYRRGAYGTWGGYETTVTQYTEGTLNLDIVEDYRDQLVWEGVLVGRITEKTLQNLDEALTLAVQELFKHYPYRAP